MTSDLAQVGTIPGLIGGSAYKGSQCYKRSAGLHTPSGPWLSTKLGGAKTSRDSPSAPMPTIGLSRLLTHGSSSSPLWSDTRRISPWRPEPRRRLAAGLAPAGSVVLLLGMGAPRARAYDGEVRRACLKASRLLQTRALGQRIDVPVADVSSSGITMLISAILIAGRYTHAPMQGQTGRELCLFEQRTRRATVAPADQLDRPRPQPGSPLSSPTKP
jgi:hypothetical protein